MAKKAISGTSVTTLVDPRCCPCRSKDIYFECPKDRMAGAEKISRSTFRLHFVEFTTNPTHRDKKCCVLKRTGIIDLMMGIANEYVRQVRRWVQSGGEDFSDGGETSGGVTHQGEHHIRQIVLLVNPRSGKRMSAKKILDNRILPIVQNVFGWHVETRTTTGPGDALQVLQQARLSSYDLIGIVGGDGTFHEALQGLMRRTEIERYSGIPLVPIPAGTGNALATSLGLYDVDTTLFSILKNQLKQLDIIYVFQNSRPIYSFLGVMYGALTSIDIGSERCRWMGSTRFDVAALMEILKMPQFDAKFAYLPYGVNNDLEIHADSSTQSTSAIEEYKTTISEEVKNWFLHGGSDSHGPHGWVMASSFATRLLAILSLPYISNTSHFMPNASVGDRKLHLVHVPADPQHTRGQLLELFQKSREGTHLTLNWVESTAIRAFLFKPGDRATWVTVDGEIVSRDDLLSMEILPFFLNVISTAC